MYSHIDAVAVLRDDEVAHNLRRYCTAFGITPLWEYVTHLASNNVFPITKELRTSKLSYLSEGGGKTRVIAIGDYWSQQALYPLHKSLMYYLHQLQTDGTSSHNRVSNIVRDYTKRGSPAFCFDLTSATDRFPRILERDLISSIYGEEIADSWLELMASRTFNSNGKDIRYGQGQPMGFYSSWAAFALTHHAIIEFCAQTEGVKTFREYVVIGDDVAIFNEKVAKSYEKILKDIDVPISTSKSIISYGGTSSQAEIAKRLFLNGNEISPLPPKIVIKARKDPKIFPMLIEQLLERGTRVTLETAKTLFCNWFPKNKTLVLLGTPPGFPGHIKWSESPASEPYRCQPRIDSPNAVTPETVLNSEEAVLSKLREVFLKKRLLSLQKKYSRMEKMQTRLATVRGDTSARTPAMGVSSLLHRKGVPILVSEPDAPVDVNHPLIPIIFNEMMDLLDLSERLEDEDYEDLDPKEYVPDITIGKYFRTNQEYRQMHISSLMLESIYEVFSEDN